MHTIIHPSQWFHHEPMAGPARHRLRELLRSGAFWATVLLFVAICAMLALAIIGGLPPGGEANTTPYYLP